MSGHPSNWYQCNGKCPDPPRGARYEFPLPEVEDAPVPSQADYSPKKVAWFMEQVGLMTGISENNMKLVYENNTPSDRSDDIEVTHPGDKKYLPESHACNKPKSYELQRYEDRAKKSDILKLYEENSPAKIKYFQSFC